MRKEKIFGGVLVLLLLCTCVGACGASMAYQSLTQTETQIDSLYAAGTWVGEQSFFVAYYKAQLVCNADGTGKLTGNYHVLGNRGSLNEDFTWELVEGDEYIGHAYGRSVPFTAGVLKLTVTVNPVALGFIDNSLLDRDFDVVFYRNGGSPSIMQQLEDYLNFLRSFWL
jgi:hypothetical protein